VEQQVSLNLVAVTNENVLIGNMTFFSPDDGQEISKE
jgi:hypothetical protein